MKKASYNVAVIGATGTVGRELVGVLLERGFPLAELRLYATSASEGSELEGCESAVEPLRADTDLKGADLVFLACPAPVAEDWSERARAAGAFVIDVTAGCRGAKVELVVPEVNAERLAHSLEHRVAGSAHPVALALAVLLSPVRELAALQRVVATVLEPVSSLGRRGVDVLEHEVHALLNGIEPEEPEVFSQRVAFNVFPALPGGEGARQLPQPQEIASQLRQILRDPRLAVEIVRVRVPVFFGLGLSVDVTLRSPVTLTAVEEMLRSAPGLLLARGGVGRPGEPRLPLPSPATVVGSDATHVTCLGVDPQVPAASFWLALDNTRKGSATNAVQIAELLVRDYL
ncbi:MAG: Asd/ArgC dimerization domain-containing protein [Candidatus Binatia bacterium]|nr:Asd/ArgC dimerization domain-containing protein [Candidatus Binatia bacterium]